MSFSENKTKDVAETEEKVKERYFDFYFSDFWRGFVKFWWVSIVAAILVGGFMCYRSRTTYVPKYTASVTFTVQTQNAVLSGDGGMSAYSYYYDMGTANQMAEVFPVVLKSNILQKHVCRELGVDNMPATLSATGIDESNMITLSATGDNPQLTYDTLMCVMKNYSKVSEYIIGQTRLEIIDEAKVPVSPSNPNTWRTDTIKGALIGIAVGILWIFVYGVLRRTIRTKEDIKRELNQKCIGVMPQVFFKKYKSKIDKRILLSNPLVGNAFLESVRLLRDSLHNALEPGDKVIMFTSTAPGEGKSVTTVNLAAIYAKNDENILLMDCDIRNSGIRKLINNNELEIKDKVYDENGEILYSISRVENLDIDLLSFNYKEKNLSKMLNMQVNMHGLEEIVNSLREKYDLIFIDTPPCGMIADAAIVAAVADGAVYVIRQDTVMDTNIRQGLDTLENTDVRLMGCILNGAVGGIGGYGSSYGYGYGYSGYKKYYRNYKYYGKSGYRKNKY